MATGGLNLRRRGTIYSFRRRVPDALVERVGRKEIVRSLETCSRAEAGRRGRAVWLATEGVFSLMRDEQSLERAQVDVILRRLVREPPWESPTRAELLEDFRRSQPRVMDLLFGEEARQAILALPQPEQKTVLDHLDRLLDGAAIAVHEAEASNARAEAETFELRSLLAERRRRDAHWTALACRSGRSPRSRPAASAASCAPSPPRTARLDAVSLSSFGW
jgi:hypothetical protein